MSICNQSTVAPLLRSSFTLAATVFILLNLTLSGLSATKTSKLERSMFQESWLSDHYGHLGAWWVAKSYIEQAKAPDIVVFGSSQMGGLQGADANTVGHKLDFVYDHESFTLEAALKNRRFDKVRSFTAALPGAMISDHYLLSRALFNQPLKPSIVVLGLSPRDFIDSTLPAACATEPYTQLSRFANLGSTDKKYYDNVISAAERTLSEALPLRRLSHGQTLPEFFDCSGNIRPGLCTVEPHHTIAFFDNTYEYRVRYRKPNCKSLPQQFAFLDEFLGAMQSQNIKVLVTGMPLMPSNRALLPAPFWQNFRTRVADLCSRHEATWLDLSESPQFSTPEFVDTVHTNSAGGYKLAQAIAEKLSSEQQFVAALQRNASPKESHSAIAAAANKRAF